MTTNDAFGEQRLYVTSKIKRFSGVRNIADYLKVVARLRKSEILYAGRRSTKNFIHQLRTWSRSDRLALTIVLLTLIGLVVTILALLVVAGIVIL